MSESVVAMGGVVVEERFGSEGFQDGVGGLDFEVGFGGEGGDADAFGVVGGDFDEVYGAFDGLDHGLCVVVDLGRVVTILR